MTAWTLVIGAIAMVLAGIFGPAVFRSGVRKRLGSGSTVLEDGATVTLTGTIRETEPLLESPLSGKRGVLVHAQAQLPEQTEDGPLILAITQLMPFELDTPQGVVLVEATAADLAIKPRAPRPRDAAREEAFVVARGRGAQVARVATFRELVLAPGQRIAVHGVARIATAEQGERGYRDAVPARVRIVAPAGHALAIGEPA